MSNKASINNDKNHILNQVCNHRENQLVMKAYKKRCLIGLQKGVSKGLKGHLLKVN